MLVPVVLSALLGFSATGPSPGHTRDFLESQLRYPRVAAAQASKVDGLRRMFRAANAAWPPQGVFLRAFKLEGEVELWAPRRGKRRWVRVAQWPICRSSGDLGPKRFEGDGQVPEGFYRVDRFNPVSAYHLSLGLDYPNAVDRHRAGPKRSAGSDIFVHGACVTVGCLPMTDRVIASIYITAVYARANGARHLPVHIFPCRFGRKGCERALSKHPSKRPKLRSFWKVLRRLNGVFERSGVPPMVVATSDGNYQLAGALQRP